MIDVFQVSMQFSSKEFCFFHISQSTVCGWITVLEVIQDLAFSQAHRPHLGILYTKQWRRSVENIGGSESMGGDGGECGCFPYAARAEVAPPKMFGQTLTFWFVLVKKMCFSTLDRNVSKTSPSHYWGQRYSLDPTSNIGGHLTP